MMTVPWYFNKVSGIVGTRGVEGVVVSFDGGDGSADDWLGYFEVFC